MIEAPRFTAVSRLLHWLMAAMVLTMLFVGLGMVSTVSGRYHGLLAIHRPLGIAILVLAVIRLANRLLHPGPPLPGHLNRLERFAALGSQVVFYTLMIFMPLIGWGMLSAARYPVVLAGSVHLPAILPHDPLLYATLRRAHTLLAYAFIATFIAHFGAALVHAWIYRDGVFASMAPWRARPSGKR
ncbi:MAG TPA: cytochrome b [Steroidobacteraceae bacterium]